MSSRLRRRFCRRKVAPYIDVAQAATHVHQVIWYYGENNEFPKGLAELPSLDAVLSDALSRIPPLEEGE